MGDYLLYWGGSAGAALGAMLGLVGGFLLGGVGSAILCALIGGTVVGSVCILLAMIAANIHEERDYLWAMPGARDHTSGISACRG